MTDWGDGAYVGYLLRGVEESLARIHTRLARMERKIDALATEMTTEERAAVIAQLNADAAKLDSGAATIDALTDTLNKTA